MESVVLNCHYVVQWRQFGSSKKRPSLKHPLMYLLKEATEMRTKADWYMRLGLLLAVVPLGLGRFIPIPDIVQGF